MLGKNNLNLLARLALLMVAIIWGSTLVVSASTTGTIAPNLLIALRFLIAFVLLAVVFYKRMPMLNKGYILSGAVIGLCLFLAHSAQTLGVTEAEGLPGRSGFLSASYCVVVPFLAWAILRRRPDAYNIIAGVLCLSGIGLVSFGGAAPPMSDSVAAQNIGWLNLPDALALLSGVFFAAHIVTIEKFSLGKDPVLITIVQFLFAGFFSLIAVTVREPEAYGNVQWDAVWKAIVYLAVVCTALALLLQNLGQKYTDSSSAAIILGTESVFCVLFGVLLVGETVSLMAGVGFVLILAAIIVSETKLSFFKRPPSARGPRPRAGITS